MILIWEAEPDIRELVSYNLQKAGYNILAVEAETDLRTAFESFRPKMVILGAMIDIKLQCEVYKQICTLDTTYDTRIVCMVTNSKSCSILIPKKRQQLDFCLKIPIRPSALVRTIRDTYLDNALPNA